MQDKINKGKIKVPKLKHKIDQLNQDYNDDYHLFAPLNSNHPISKRNHFGAYSNRLLVCAEEDAEPMIDKYWRYS